MKKKAGQLERAHIFYSGRVQGVGFRYTVERFALDLALLGWVKNLPDGRVEVVCEGPRPHIEKLLVLIRESAMGPHIRKADCSWEAATGKFDDFRVEFYF